MENKLGNTADSTDSFLKEMVAVIGDAFPKDGPGKYSGEELINALSYVDAVTNRGIKAGVAADAYLTKPNTASIARYVIDKIADGEITQEQTNAMGSIAEIAIRGYNALGQFVKADAKGIPAENNLETAMQLLGVKNPVVTDYRDRESSAVELLIYISESVEDGDVTEFKTGTEESSEYKGITEVPVVKGELSSTEQTVHKYDNGLEIPVRTSEQIEAYRKEWEQKNNKTPAEIIHLGPREEIVEESGDLEIPIRTPEQIAEYTEKWEQDKKKEISVSTPTSTSELSDNQKFHEYENGLKIPVKTQEEITAYCEEWEQSSKNQ